MGAFIHFTNQTWGWSQLIRATQYTCMLLGYLLEPTADKEKVGMKLRKLESTVNTGHKWFILGNAVHSAEHSGHRSGAPLMPDICQPELFGLLRL